MWRILDSLLSNHYNLNLLLGQLHPGRSLINKRKRCFKCIHVVVVCMVIWHTAFVWFGRNDEIREEYLSIGY